MIPQLNENTTYMYIHKTIVWIEDWFCIYFVDNVDNQTKSNQDYAHSLMNCSTYVGGVCGGWGSVDDRTGRILMSGFEPIFTSCEGSGGESYGTKQIVL